VRLDAQKLPTPRAALCYPLRRLAAARRADTCLAAIANTAGSLGLDNSAEESAD